MEPGVDDVARRTGVLMRLEWMRLGSWRPAPKPPAPGPPDERRAISERIHGVLVGGVD